MAVSAALAAVLWFAVPYATTGIAALVPAPLEERLGDAVLAHIPGRRCSNAQGQAAAETLVRRLVGKGVLPYEVRIEVVDDPRVNAFAAPGARILLLNGLLQRATSPDEVAGVLAHELSHAIERHGTRHLIRAAGISFAFELMLGSGGALRSAGETIIALSYARDLEREADEGAVELLRSAGIGSEPLAKFLDRMQEDEPRGRSLPEWLGTHPATAERSAKLRAGATPGGTPALDESGWQALRRICENPE